MHTCSELGLYTSLCYRRAMKETRSNCASSTRISNRSVNNSLTNRRRNKGHQLIQHTINTIAWLRRSDRLPPPLALSCCHLSDSLAFGRQRLQRHSRAWNAKCLVRKVRSSKAGAFLTANLTPNLAAPPKSKKRKEPESERTRLYMRVSNTVATW